VAFDARESVQLLGVSQVPYSGPGLCRTNGLPSFENITKLCEPHIISKETAAKLKRLSKFGLLRYRYGTVLVSRNILNDGPDHEDILAKQAPIRSSI
jgi:hypothetical protein